MLLQLVVVVVVVAVVVVHHSSGERGQHCVGEPIQAATQSFEHQPLVHESLLLWWLLE